MKRMKTFAIYALCILGFMLLSQVLITVALNSTYKAIQRKNEVSQINIYQAEANSVAGRVKGIVTNYNGNLSGKYIKLDFYTKRDVCMGTKYIEIKDLEENESQAFEVYFKLDNISSYEVSISEETEETEETSFFTEDFKKIRIYTWILCAMIIW